MLAELVLTALAVSGSPSVPAAHGGRFQPPPPPPRAGGGAQPTPGVGGGPRSPRPEAPASRGRTGPNLLHWSQWWNLERDRYLLLRERVRVQSEAPAGRTAVLNPVGIAPSRQTVDSRVLPTLIQALADERGDDVITAALIAAGRIGAGADGSFGGRLHVAISAHLAAPSQEVAETAVLALGLLGGPRALDTLLEVVLDTDGGARATGRGRVPTRTRAFAAIALGILSDEHEDAAVRQRAALALADVLGGPHVTDDLSAAATIGFGLALAPIRPTVPDARLRDEEHVDIVLSRSNQLRWFEEHLNAGTRPGATRPFTTRAQECVALARLAAGCGNADRERVVERLASTAGRRSESDAVRAAALIGLGEIACSTGSPSDARALRTLETAIRTGQPLEQRMATIALATAGSRPGFGEDPLEKSAVVRRTLLHELVRGDSGNRPWAALALGVFGYALHDAGVDESDTTGRALADFARRQRNASFAGAYAIGCALACERGDDAEREAAGDALIGLLESISDPTSRGHVALALGLLRHAAARDALRAIAENARFQPSLLWNSSVALGLIGDDVTPMLVDALTESKSSASRAAAASALGHVGDGRAVTPLLAVFEDRGQPTMARAFALVALGVVCDERPLPWRTPIAHALPYFAITSTLSGNARGILEIL